MGSDLVFCSEELKVTGLTVVEEEKESGLGARVPRHRGRSDSFDPHGGGVSGSFEVVQQAAGTGTPGSEL